jgi:hypothetical protein
LLQLSFIKRIIIIISSLKTSDLSFGSLNNVIFYTTISELEKCPLLRC